MNDTERMLQLLGEKSRVTPRTGMYVGTANGQALVDMGEGRFPAAFLTGYVPTINEPVNVWSVDGLWFLVGPTTAKPGIGVVSTTGGDTVTVTTDFGDFTMPFVGTAPTSGDSVGILWPGPVCVGALSIQPVDPTPPPDPGAGSTLVKTATFLAIDAGSTDRGAPRWWSEQPQAGNSTYGAWFYGNQIKDTIPAGAQLHYVNGTPQIEFHVSRVQDQGGAPRFALHDAGSKGPVPGFGGYIEWDPPNGWHIPPDPEGWFAGLKAGGLFAGVGLNQGGYNIFASRAQDGFTGALRIKWL